MSHRDAARILTHLQLIEIRDDIELLTSRFKQLLAALFEFLHGAHIRSEIPEANRLSGEIAFELLEETCITFGLVSECLEVRVQVALEDLFSFRIALNFRGDKALLHGCERLMLGTKFLAIGLDFNLDIRELQVCLLNLRISVRVTNVFR